MTELGVRPASQGETALESLSAAFVDFGLSVPEARVLCALLQQGSAVASRLASLAGLTRPNVYPLLESLVARGVATRVPGPAGVWTTPGWAAVIEHLHRGEANRLEALTARRDEALALVEELSPAVLSAALPYVHVLQAAPETAKAFVHLLARSSEEVLVCNKPPYAKTSGAATPAVLEAVGRGVVVRALYGDDAIIEPVEEWRAGIEVYHAAGVVGRVVEKIPVKMAVFDRKASLVTLTDPRAPAVGFPTVLLIEQPDMAELLAGSFEHLWAVSQPYPVAADRLEGSSR